jgi:hypothetical protein
VDKLTNFLIDHPKLITLISFVIIFILGFLLGWMIRGEKAKEDEKILMEDWARLAECKRNEGIDTYA